MLLFFYEVNTQGSSLYFVIITGVYYAVSRSWWEQISSADETWNGFNFDFTQTTQTKEIIIIKRLIMQILKAAFFTV